MKRSLSLMRFEITAILGTFTDIFLVALQLLPNRIMIDVTLSILALIAGGVTLEVFGSSWRPSGQDERGFKLAAKVAEGPEEFQSGNPS